MKPKMRTDNLVVQEMDGEVLIYDLTIDKAFCLNETSARVWSLCDGTRDRSEIAAELKQTAGMDATLEVVRLALSQLADQHLLENHVKVVASAPPLARREMMSLAGKALVIGLPLVSTLMVPSAAQAQSAATCSGNSGQVCSCIDKVRNFNIPCVSNSCSGNCQCQPPFTGCNGGGHFCQGLCG